MSAIILSISLKRPIAAAIAATLGLGLVPQLAVGQPMHGIAMHGEPALPADYDHLPYANPDAPKGGKIAFGGQGTFDSLNPFIRKGAVPDGLWGRNAFWANNVWDSLMVQELGRAVHALRPHRPVRRGARRPFVGGVHAQSARPLLRRDAGDHRGRRLHLQPVEGQGPAAELVQERRPHRAEAGRQGALRLRPRLGPRDAAARRAAAGVSRARHRPGGVRRIRPQPADRKRALHHRRRQRRQLRDAEAQPGLLGQGPAGEARLRQLRRDPHRVHPQRHRPVRGLHQGHLRRHQRGQPDAVDGRRTTFPPPRRARSSRRRSRPACRTA